MESKVLETSRTSSGFVAAVDQHRSCVKKCKLVLHGYKTGLESNDRVTLLMRSRAMTFNKASVSCRSQLARLIHMTMSIFALRGIERRQRYPETVVRKPQEWMNRYRVNDGRHCMCLRRH